MSKKVKFELNMKGLNELMKSTEMENAIRDAAGAVVNYAGPGVDAEIDTVWDGKWVVGAKVSAESEDAKKDNLENNTLIKAANSAGLSFKKGRGKKSH